MKNTSIKYILETLKYNIRYIVISIIVFASNNYVFAVDNFSNCLKFKFHPLAILSPRPNLLFGSELKIKKLGIELSYGRQIAFLSSSNPDTSRVKNYGYKFKIELKYYLKPIIFSKDILQFLSIGFLNIYSKQNLTEDWFSGYRFSPSLAYLDKVQVYMVNYGLCTTNSNWLAEIALNTGIRFRKNYEINTNGAIIGVVHQTLPHFGISGRIGYMIPLIKSKSSK